MNFDHKQTLSLGILLAIIFANAWILQAHMMLKGDIVWGMYMAKALLAGGGYITNFFEVNPPLIIFIYVPAVLIAKYLSVTNTIAIRIDMFLLVILSLSLVFYLLKKLFLKQDVIFAILTLTYLAFAFLILPGNEFGQRENQIVIFTVPYLFLLAARLKNIDMSWGIPLLVGFCAGIGFAIKPFYLLTFLMLEIYYWFSIKKNTRLFLARPELHTALFMIMLYLAVIFIFFKSYLHVVVPIALQFYFQNFSDTWPTMLSSVIFLYCLLSLLICSFYLLLVKFTKYNNPLISYYHGLLQIFSLSLTGYLIAYLYQKINWYYHIIPAFYLANQLYFSLLFLLLRSKKSNMPDVFIYYFLLCSLVFILLDFCIPLPRIILLAYLSILLYFLLIIFNKKKFLGAVLMLLSILSSIAPLFTIYWQNQNGIFQKKALLPLASYLVHHSHQQSVYFISAQTAYMNSVLDLANIPLNSRIQFSFWTRKTSATPHFKIINHYFASILAIDIEKNKPGLILVDRQPYFPNQQPNQISSLPLLLLNRSFYLAWQHYTYRTTLIKPFIYQFDVFERTE